jgi:aryl-alcohol dehydrogenase-like predicted oxidoreductase
MRQRKLGRTSLELPVVVFGAWALGGWNWGGSDDEEAVRAIQKALDLGMRAIDTAPVYGFGRSERIVGRAIAGRRAEVLLLTKVGLRWDDERGEFYFQTVDSNGETRRVHRNLRPWSIRHEVQESLKRLDTDWIDLIQVHWPDAQVPIAESMGALLELRSAGMVREIGVSNFPPRMLDEASAALGDVPLASTQPKYSLVAREIERDVLPWCQRFQVGAIVYSPLEQGLLTGKVSAERTFREGDGRTGRWTFEPTNRARVNAVLERVVRPIAQRHGATLAQTVIAWTVAQPGVTSAIVGARTVAQVVEKRGRGGARARSRGADAHPGRLRGARARAARRRAGLRARAHRQAPEGPVVRRLTEARAPGSPRPRPRRAGACAGAASA